MARIHGSTSKEVLVSAMLAIACEEIVANTIQYGYKRHHKAESIDISLSRSEDSLLLRIRDDGIAFDPTVYSTEEKEEFRFNGIEVVRNVADDFKYLRVLNTNNTIISVLLSRHAEEKSAA
jgi:anti-sigma regulatory factor (Ser/Thr protein kinase)